MNYFKLYKVIIWTTLEGIPKTNKWNKDIRNISLKNSGILQFGQPSCWSLNQVPLKKVHFLNQISIEIKVPAAKDKEF